MRIIADLDNRKHAFIIGSITCCQFQEPRPIRFLVDTGASLTTILSYDTIRLGIDCTQLDLSNNSFNTANGWRAAYHLPKVQIKLKTNDETNQESTITLTLTGIPCFPPPNTIDSSMVAEDTYSLLGMDVLFLFKKWQYTDNTLTLEDHI